MSHQKKIPATDEVKSPFPAARTMDLVNDTLVRPRHVFNLMRGVKGRGIFLWGWCEEPGRWMVYQTGRGLARVWLNEKGDGVWLVAQAVGPFQPGAKRIYRSGGFLSLVLLCLALVLGMGWWAMGLKSLAASALMLGGAFLTVFSLWRALGWKSSRPSAQHMLSMLGAALVVEQPFGEIRPGLNALERHRREVMEKLQSQKQGDL